MLFEPGRGVGACRVDPAALFMNLVDSHLHQFLGNALAAKIIVHIGVVDRIYTGCVLRKGDFCQNLSVFIFSLDTVGKSDIIAHFSPPLQELLVVDRTASADKFRAAAGTDNGCFSNLFDGNTKRNDNGADMHADQSTANIDTGGCLLLQ